MSPKQEKLYWREWAAVHRTDPSLDRHELHIAALGEDVSHKAFTNSQFDTVLGAMRAISKPASLEAQLRQLNGTKRRLIWKISVEQLAILRIYHKTAGYILSIANDKFPRIRETLLITPNPDLGEILELLEPGDLEQLRSTLAAIIHAHCKSAKHGVHGMLTLAGLPCHCRKCKPRPIPGPRVSPPAAMPANQPF